MEYCPFCGSTDTMYYHFLMNVLVCTVCGLSHEHVDIDQVDDYLFVDDAFVCVSSHYLPLEETATNGLNYDVLKHIKQKKGPS